MDTINTPIPSDQKFNFSLFYSEGCSTLRHYSQAVKNIRTITIAQGLAVIYAITFLTKEEEFILSILAGLFGLVLTCIFYFLHQHYLNLSIASLEYIRKLEEVEFAHEGIGSAIKNARSKFWSKWIVRFIFTKALYLLLSISMATVIIFDLLKIIQPNI
ncbi:MAG: hypothetical protein DHS20C13_22260 [Thermodesulfobacteriota bacterium]|nr:MAG: hypothetical protein DHS20C13_22260 [Thermodesulfobacteriota bacterium]GJM35922.1 MAG: hypothetical protein DHS20C18_49230 [Saprospiraceae bacterium]